MAAISTAGREIKCEIPHLRFTELGKKPERDLPVLPPCGQRFTSKVISSSLPSPPNMKPAAGLDISLSKVPRAESF